jgi:hypothetical protein
VCPAGTIPNHNPAEHVELEPGTEPKALVWTDEQVAHWLATGEKPSPVMVRTPEQTGTFLDHIVDHRLEVMWRPIAFGGPRRGEGCGPRWTDFSKKSRSLQPPNSSRTAGTSSKVSRRPTDPHLTSAAFMQVRSLV